MPTLTRPRPLQTRYRRNAQRTVPQADLLALLHTLPTHAAPGELRRRLLAIPNPEDRPTPAQP